MQAPSPSPQAPSEGAIELFAATDQAARRDVRLAVTVPTYRRPDHLRDTLRSVVGQECGLPFAVVVMENETEARKGAEAAVALLAEAPVPSAVVLAHRRGNCAAYNAGWWTALERYPALEWILVIDDDEIARPGWIAAMLRCAGATGADIVGAPQVPRFEAGGDARAAEHPVFRPPYVASGTVPVLYSSGNVLIRADLLRRHGHPWLDERFNFLGGGDSDFYARNRRSGARFAWCVEGALDETVPARRSELSWLNARALRNGSISALIERRAARGPADHARRIAKSAALLAASAPRSLRLAVRSRSLASGLTHMNVAIGRLLMEFDFANEQYRAADRN